MSDIDSVNHIENFSERIAADKKLLLAERYVAPIPHPQILAQYEKIVPGMAKAITDDYLANANVVREIGFKSVNAEIEKDKRGQWMALFVAYGVIGVSVFAIIHNYPWVAGTACFAALGTIGAAYLGKGKSK